MAEIRNREIYRSPLKMRRSKLYSNTNYILLIISNISHIYESLLRKAFRYVRILFGIPKLKRRNDAVKRLNVIAADLKKLKI
jgi:hypothetical protein